MTKKPYHLGSPYGSVFVFLIFSQKCQVFYHEKNWHEASWEILQNFPIWEILHWCKERRIKRKKKKILHAWNELSTQDWTTLRFVLGNIWGLTLAKVFVKKFFLKFIHPNRHTYHGVCFSLLPHPCLILLLKNFYIKVHIKLFCFKTQSLLNIYKSLCNDST